jgi:hypothetical protein
MWKWQPRAVLLDQFLRDLYLSIMLLTNADTGKGSWYDDRFYLWESFQKECCRSTTISRLSKTERRSAIIIIITNLDFCPSIPWNCACVILFSHLPNPEITSGVLSTLTHELRLPFLYRCFPAEYSFFFSFLFLFQKEQAGIMMLLMCQCFDCL